jgi:hypothetical protein
MITLMDSPFSDPSMIHKVFRALERRIVSICTEKHDIIFITG